MKEFSFKLNNAYDPISSNFSKKKKKKTSFMAIPLAIIRNSVYSHTVDDQSSIVIVFK